MAIIRKKITASQSFKKWFRRRFLVAIYELKTKNRTSRGVDGVNLNIFEKQKDDHLDVICKKVPKGAYKYSFYKELLISKGFDRKPRQLSIPTIRDKIVLTALKELLFDVFPECVNRNLVQNYIFDLNTQVPNYDSYIRYDLAKFYDTIDPEILKKILFKKIRKNEIRTLLFDAITKKTVPSTNKSTISKIPIRKKGIPQGLPISNILADIYIHSIDQHFMSLTNCFYSRYVDDILILCDSSDIDNLKKDFTYLIEEKQLEINLEKSSDGKISEGIEYLGYYFKGSLISIRSSSMERFRKSIISIFTKYKHAKNKKPKLLTWELNLKITGGIYQNKKYGWVFFFSQINDLELLYRMDNFIQKMCKKNNIPTAPIKRLVRAYNEITKNLNSTTYIKDFDRFSLEQKKRLLIGLNIYGPKSKVDSMTSDEISTAFNKLISKKINELERDIQKFS